MKLPKIGDKIYIPSAYHISNGEDDVEGGLATVESIEVSKFVPLEHPNSIFVTFVETGKAVSYNWKHLMKNQEKWSKEYVDKAAHPSPDINTPWIEEGDIVNGSKYKGPPIW